MVKKAASKRDFFVALAMLRQLDFSKYSPAVVGLVGSQAMVDELFNNISTSIWDKNIEKPLRNRLQKLLSEFIPQIAEYNSLSIEELVAAPTKEELSSLFANAKLPKMLRGENKIFLRVIYHSIKNFLESIPEQ